MKLNRLKVALLFTLVILCTGCDLTTKWLAAQHLQWANPVTIIPNLIELRYTENEAIAFSMLRSIDSGTRRWIIYSLSTFALIFLVLMIWEVRKDSFLGLTALMLILSGAIGNLTERIFRGYVIDFIHLHYYDRFSWPIFNVADILITCGGILLAILMLRRKKKHTE
ncbi:MAG: signal peptidase II [candidate division KSB1 bacterium]|nr:signal peptidase II [candidate division KSB1 bacterium]MDZ7335895.1 signal peptidase II [candidate division KSB1 bacterium]MDZ7398568.1 signal peptidase II [candidate division KSB1 bacterium]